MRRLWRFCKRCAVPIIVLCIALIACSDAAKLDRVPPADTRLSLRTGVRLAVIGVSQGKSRLRRADKKRLQNRRIGFGLNNLLAEALFDTGNFRLLEGKDIRQRELLEDLVNTYWIERGATYSAQELRRVATQLGVKLLAYGSVSHARSSSGRFSLGPLSRHTQKLRVRVNVCLYDASTGTILCQEGQGEARQEGTGVIYEFHGDRLDFENNAAGRATKQAVTLAVREIVASIRFVP